MAEVLGHSLPTDSEQAPSILSLTPKLSFLFSAPEDTPVLQDSEGGTFTTIHASVTFCTI